MTRDELESVIRTALFTPGPAAEVLVARILGAADEYAAEMIEQCARPPVRRQSRNTGGQATKLGGRA